MRRYRFRFWGVVYAALIYVLALGATSCSGVDRQGHDLSTRSGSDRSVHLKKELSEYLRQADQLAFAESFFMSDGGTFGFALEGSQLVVVFPHPSRWPVARKSSKVPLVLLNDRQATVGGMDITDDAELMKALAHRFDTAMGKFSPWGLACAKWALAGRMIWTVRGLMVVPPEALRFVGEHVASQSAKQPLLNH